MLYDVLPLVFAAARNNDLKIINHSAYRQAPRDDNNARDVFSSKNPSGSVVRHGATIVSDDDSSLVLSPSQKIRVRRFA